MPEKEKKGPGKWFRRIPKEILTSPGGVLLIFMAAIMEILDLIPGGSLAWEIIPEVIFCAFLSLIAKIPFLRHIIPFLIERIPGLSDFLPTWFLRLIL